MKRFHPKWLLLAGTALALQAHAAGVLYNLTGQSMTCQIRGTNSEGASAVLYGGQIDRSGSVFPIPLEDSGPSFGSLTLICATSAIAGSAPVFYAKTLDADNNFWLASSGSTKLPSGTGDLNLAMHAVSQPGDDESTRTTHSIDLALSGWFVDTGPAGAPVITDRLTFVKVLKPQLGAFRSALAALPQLPQLPLPGLPQSQQSQQLPQLPDLPELPQQAPSLPQH